MNASRKIALGLNSLTHFRNFRSSVSDISLCLPARMRNKHVDHHQSGFSMTETEEYGGVTEVGDHIRVDSGLLPSAVNSEATFIGKQLCFELRARAMKLSPAAERAGRSPVQAAPAW
jgi:hypothetical protein